MGMGIEVTDTILTMTTATDMVTIAGIATGMATGMAIGIAVTSRRHPHLQDFPGCLIFPSRGSAILRR